MVEASAAAWFGAAGLEVTGIVEEEGEVVVGCRRPAGRWCCAGRAGAGPARRGAVRWCLEMLRARTAAR